MMRAMYSGVSGLRIHQTKMDVIGNNIANVNTIGFKASNVTFNDAFSQTLQAASGYNEDTGRGGTNPMQIGLGAGIASISNNMTQGCAERTDNTMDMMIEGNGFFILNDGIGNKFSRAGAFKMDSGSGYLTNADGLNVMGWETDNITNEIKKDTVKPLRIFSVDKAFSTPVRTTNASISGNINKDDKQINDGGRTVLVNFYDKLGYKYNVELTIINNKVNVNENSNPPEIEISDEKLDLGQFNIIVGNITDSQGDTVANVNKVHTIQFDQSGSGVLAGDSVKGINIFPVDNITFEDGTVIDINSEDDKKGISSISGVESNEDIKNTGIYIDFSKLSMINDDTSLNPSRGNYNGIGAGREAGFLSSFSIGADGKIQGIYSNGDNRLLGQIAIAEFKNPAGLEKVGNNLYIDTLNSGEFNGIGIDPTSSGGQLKTGVLEMSNVDLAKEFTNMITAQRGFQANSRIITASDEMLQELVNLKR